MKRTQLLQLLHRYQPEDSAEIVFKQEIVDFINQHEDCFERSLTIGHITASAWLLNGDGTKALLMHHAKLNKWFQLGGHCDGNPDVLAVALQEAHEESGIQQVVPITMDIFDIDVHEIPETPKEKAHYHYDIRFLLRVVGNEQIVQNSESKELRWIGKNIEELPTDNRSVVRMFHKWASL